MNSEFRRRLTFPPQGGGRGCKATKVATTTHRLCRNQNEQFLIALKESIGVIE